MSNLSTTISVPQAMNNIFLDSSYDSLYSVFVFNAW
jgi:hypothetical protein